jgi:DNA-binding transcriptional LysR family regulator
MRGADHAELRAFVTVVEHRSFTRAAAHLGMSPSALSQTIRNLEARLQTRLLNRTTRSVAPSEAGERLLARLLPALRDLDAAVEQLSELRGVAAGRLRINTNRFAAVHCLAPLAAPFLKSHPEIQLEIVVDDRLADIVAGGFDAGVRLGEKLERDMVAVKLGGELRMIAVASPAYCAANGVPNSPRDLTHHHCLNSRWPTNGALYRWEFERDGEALEITVNGPLIADDADVLTRAARDGLGIAYLFEQEVAEFVASGDLIPLLQEWSPTFPGLFLYYPSRQHMHPPLRAFLDFAGASGIRR